VTASNHAFETFGNLDAVGTGAILAARPEMIRHLLLLLCLLATPALAEFKVTLTPSGLRVGTGDVLEMTVEVSDPPPGTVVEWPASPDFERLKPSSSSTRRAEGGVVKLQAEMRAFRPTRKGSLVFPPVTVRTPTGTTAVTAKVSIDVIEGHVATASRVKRERRPSAALVLPSGATDFFLDARLSDESPTLGDPVEVQLRLFVRVGVKVRSIEQIQLALDDSAMVTTELVLEPLPQDVTIDGVTFAEIPLRAVRLMPLAVGTLTLAAPSAEVTLSGTRHALTAPLPPLVVSAADDARTALTVEEATAVLERKAPFTERLVKLKPPMPMKSLRFE
jgi:hypothetical protein